MSEYIVVHSVKVATEFVPETFGRLTTAGPRFRLPSGNKGAHATYQVHTCSCGNTILCAIVNVQAGRTQSCGCLNDESRVTSNTKHGHTSRGNKWSLTYRSYSSMKNRCYYKANNRYPDYGGRGIMVCDRWLEPNGQGFLNFLADMGPRPSPEHSVERKEVNGNYCPENCRWATLEEQAVNKNSNVNLTFCGKTQCIAEWSREVGIKANTISCRIKRGWSVEKTLATPTKAKKARNA